MSYMNTGYIDEERNVTLVNVNKTNDQEWVRKISLNRDSPTQRGEDNGAIVSINRNSSNGDIFSLNRSSPTQNKEVDDQEWVRKISQNRGSPTQRGEANGKTWVVEDIENDSASVRQNGENVTTTTIVNMQDDQECQQKAMKQEVRFSGDVGVTNVGVADVGVANVGVVAKEKIAVIGSGDFGRALAGRLSGAGYEVVIGSRNPNRNREIIPERIPVKPTEEAIQDIDIVIVAVPRDCYQNLPLSQLTGKILVDVSNRTTRKNKTNMSHAEYLACMVPDARVVKAFNVLSAYALENTAIGRGNKEVYISGNDKEARESISSITRAAGFTPVDMGGLVAARLIEDIPVMTFPAWKTPLIISCSLFFVLYLITFLKFQVCWPLTWYGKWDLWKHVPMDNVNKTLAVHALVMLAACYTPGVLAGWIQLARGTKYSSFPRWLDSWLKMRKQLGLLMFFAASVHACLSLAYMSPRYNDLAFGYADKFQINENTTMKVYGSNKMHWRGECFLMAGVFGFSLVGLLAISSLPSVSSALSWREFTIIQSGLGWTSLVLLCAHDMFYGWPYLGTAGLSCYVPSSFQYALYLPFLTIFLKLPLMIPPFSSSLTKIREGQVRTKGSFKPKSVDGPGKVSLA